MTILVVGQNPGTSNPRSVNSTIYRLHAWMASIGVEQFNFTNCSLVSGKFRLSDVDFTRLLSLVARHSHIICLGNLASDCLSRINISHFKLPHPSGLNRQINDEKYIANQLSKCREFLDDGSSNCSSRCR
jgi:hypothetical protein